MKEQMTQWISVKDRLPEVDIAIIARDKNDYIAIGSYDKKGYFFLWKPLCTFDENNIIYWMPLPELPEKD